MRRFGQVRHSSPHITTSFNLYDLRWDMYLFVRCAPPLRPRQTARQPRAPRGDQAPSSAWAIWAVRPVPSIFLVNLLQIIVLPLGIIRQPQGNVQQLVGRRFALQFRWVSPFTQKFERVVSSFGRRIKRHMPLQGNAHTIGGKVIAITEFRPGPPRSNGSDVARCTASSCSRVRVLVKNSPSTPVSAYALMRSIASSRLQ